LLDDFSQGIVVLTALSMLPQDAISSF